MRRLLACACCIFGVGVLLPATASTISAQQAVTLIPAGSYAESFGYMNGVRELPDGRVMVADALGQVLVVVDLNRGTADTLGRVGSGPKEYRQPDVVYALPGDSTLLLDLGNARLTVLGPDFAFGATVSVTQSDGEGMAFVLPRSVDREGHAYYLQQGVAPGGARPDSGTVMRFERGSGQSTPIGKVKLPETTESGGQGRRMIAMRPLSPRDDWAVAADGRVAFVRAADYSVQWVEPDGRVVSGPPNAFKPVRVGEAEREEWQSDMSRSGVSVSMTATSDGTRSMSMRRGGGGGPPPDASAADWPDVAPAFRYGRSVVTPTGDLWVERYVPAGEPPLIDVFDGAGRKRGEFTLPVGCRVVGFGRGTVYLSRIDADDLQWLERYRIQ
jgi:hypothetical protein